MTMDIQKINRSEQSTPDLKMSQPNLTEDHKSSDDYHGKPGGQYSSGGQARSIKRSFDVAFLMMPDDKMKQKQIEKQLRVSKQLFSENHYAAVCSEADNFRKNHEYLNKSHAYLQRDSDDLKVTDLSTSNFYGEKYRHNNNVSPQSSQDLNIDVGTDEFATKSVLSDSDVSDMSRSRPNSTESFSRPVRVIHESPYRNKVFDDPSLISQARPNFDRHEKYMAERLADLTPRSAFTKVSNGFQGGSVAPSAASPGHSESPDNLSYQNSMSPPLTTSSPPIMSNIFTKNPSFKSFIPSNHPLLSSSNPFLKAQGMQGYHSAQSFSDHHRTGGSSDAENSSHFSKLSPSTYGEMQKSSENEKQSHFSHSSKFGHLLPFRPEMPPYLHSGGPYQFPVQSFHHPGAEFLKFPTHGEGGQLMRHPAAALLSTLLPPTLATLSLPAQNVCAKCNISFRMTSDLVYHMRSHHKSEVSYDATRRKREDKLKCPVCAESFRERHHLTRHMTAHQDKEGDLLDGLDASAPPAPPSSFCTKAKSRAFYQHPNAVHQK